MIVKLLTEHHLESLSLKGGCRGSSESTLVTMSLIYMTILCLFQMVVMTLDTIRQFIIHLKENILR